MNRKNIILLMTDQHRPDYVSFNGSKKISTPNIDRIAESVGFTCCQTVNPICTPARTALITGRYSHQIGMLAMSGDLSLQYPTYMQALQKAGYHTSGIGKFHFLQTWEWGTPKGKGINLVKIKDKIIELGYDYVWETSGKQLAVKNYCDYCEYLDSKGLLERYRDFVESAGGNSYYPDNDREKDPEPWPFREEDHVDVVTAHKIIERIENRPEDKPFFIFGSFCSPHKPFDPPKRYLDMIPYDETDDFIPGKKEIKNKKLLYKKRQAYKAMIKLLDDQIGKIFATLEKHNLLEDTVIIFTSDHGEMLGDHYRIQKETYWKASATVPTAVRHPGYLNRMINNSPVEIIDIAATILDIAGIEPREALSRKWPAFNDIIPCKSLMPVIIGESGKVRNFSFTECNGKWQMIQTERWKYVRHLMYETVEALKEEFYDLGKDPDETIDLIGEAVYLDAVEWCRKRRDLILDGTPPAQTNWAPLIEHETF